MVGKIFEKDGHKAVLLPDECSFDGEEVDVIKMGNAVVISPKGTGLNSLLPEDDAFDGWVAD